MRIRLFRENKTEATARPETAGKKSGAQERLRSDQYAGEEADARPRRESFFRRPSLWQKNAAGTDAAASVTPDDFPAPLPDDDVYSEAKRQEYLDSLSYLKSRGVKIKAIPAVFFTVKGLEENEAVFTETLNYVLNEKTFLTTFDVHGYGEKFDFPVVENADLNPEEFLEDYSGPLLNADRALLDPSRRRNRKTLTVPISLEIRGEGDDLRIVARNWFLEEPILDVVYPRALRDESVWIPLIAGIREALERHYLSFDFKGAIGALPDAGTAVIASREKTFTYKTPDTATARTERESATARASWASLTDAFDVTLSTLPADANIDTMVSQVPLQVDERHVRRNGFSGAEIDGHLQSVLLTPKNLFRMIGLSLDPLIARLDNEESLQNPAIDKYGNLIIPVFETVGKRRPQRYFTGFLVQPAYQFSREDEGVEYRPFGVDLTAFGFGDYPGLAEIKVREASSLVWNTSAYALYDAVPRLDSAEKQRVYDTAALAIADAEAFFGLEQGSAVKAVYLAPSQNKNANVFPNNPDTVFLWDEIFPNLTEDGGSYVVSHETFHCLDEQFGLSRNAALKNAYDAMASAYATPLFALIDENAYLGFGGHSVENPQEFTASLLNTLHSEKFAAHLATFSDREMALYWHALAALSEALAAVPQKGVLPMPALSRTLSVMDSIARHLGAIPDLGDLLVPTMEEMLLTEDSLPAVPVVNGFTFHRLVRRRYDFVAYVYNPDEQDAADAVRLFAHRNQGAPVIAVPFAEAAPYVNDFAGRLEGGTLYVFRRGKPVLGMDVPAWDDDLAPMGETGGFVPDWLKPQ